MATKKSSKKSSKKNSKNSKKEVPAIEVTSLEVTRTERGILCACLSLREPTIGSSR